MNPLSLVSTIVCVGLTLSGGVLQWFLQRKSVSQNMLAIAIGVLLMVTLLAAFLSLLALPLHKEGIMLIGTHIHTMA